MTFTGVDSSILLADYLFLPCSSDDKNIICGEIRSASRRISAFIVMPDGMQRLYRLINFDRDFIR